MKYFTLSLLHNQTMWNLSGDAAVELEPHEIAIFSSIQRM